MNNEYDDIIDLPHHISTKHPQMTQEARAAQFAPFAALTGYDDEVKETARLTNKRIELDDEAKSILNNKIQMIIEQLSERPIVAFTYFVPDNKKEGGKYVTVTGVVRKIDEYKQIIVLEDKIEIPINEIVDIANVDNNRI